MRKLKLLTTLPVTAMNEHEFQSETETLRFLKEIGKKVKENLRLLDQYEASIVASEFDEPAPVKKFSITDKDDKKDSWKRTDSPIQLKQIPVKQGRKLYTDNNPHLVGVEAQNLAKNFDVLKNLYHMLELVNSTFVRLEAIYKGSTRRSTIMKDLEARKAEIEKGIAKASKFLSDLANKKIPESIRDIFDFITDHIGLELKGKYKTVTEQLLITSFPLEKSGVVQISHTLDFTNLKNDKGFIYHKFYLTVTCCIYQGKRHYFVDTGFKKQVPSTAPLESHTRGPSFETAVNGLRIVQTHLKVDNALDVLMHKEIPLSDAHIPMVTSRVRKYIKKAWLDQEEKSLRIIFIPEVVPGEKYQQLITTILADVDAVVNNSRKMKALKNKPGKTKGGELSLTIWFAAGLPRVGYKYRDDKQVLRRLRDELGLSEREEHEFSKTLSDRPQTDSDFD